MPGDLDFYFDFISPYAYLATGAVRSIAEARGRTIRWKPFRLGVAVVKVMGLKPLMETPLKADYVRRDIARLARVLGLPLHPDGELPDPLPPALLFYGAPVPLREPLALALLAARWAEGRDIADPCVLKSVAASVGLDPSLVAEAVDGGRSRAALAATTREAVARGVFGSPTVAVGGELFWGADRLWLLDSYLAANETFRPEAGVKNSRLPQYGL